MLNQAKLNKISTALRNKNGIGKSAIAATALLSLLGTPAFAAEEDKNKVAEEVEVIEVKGMRGTMSRSLNIKKNTANISDGIAAADFGDLPGLSISDVIENITSVSGHRDKGSTSEISIRGLGPFLGAATFNGRSITSAGYSRAVNFKKFPSDLVDTVSVNKSQQANFVEGGVAGTINITSLRALDFGEAQTTVELAGIYNSHEAKFDGENGLGNRMTGSIIRQFETEDFGDIGFTFGFQRTDSSNPEETFKTSSNLYACGTHLADGTKLPEIDDDCRKQSKLLVTRENVNEFQEGTVFIAPSSYTFRNQEETDLRESFVATVQWQPNDDFDINLDVEFSDNNFQEDRSEFIITSALRNLKNHQIDDNMNLLYSEGSAKFESQGYYRDENERYNGLGLEIAYLVNDDLEVKGDLSYSKSHRVRDDWKSRIVTGDYWNYSYDTTNYRLPEIKFLDENYNAVGDSGYDATTAFNPADANSWSTAYNDNSAPEGRYERLIEERINDVWAARVDFNFALDSEIFTSIEGGVRYSSESLWSDLDDDVAIDPITGAQLDEYRTKDETETALLIENCFKDWNNDDWLSSEDGAGLQGSQFAQFDGRCGFGSLSQTNGTREFNDPGPKVERRSNGDVNVTENVTALYGMVNIDTEISGLPVTGNVGLRIVKTEIESLGYYTELEVLTEIDESSTDPVQNYKLIEVEGGAVSELTQKNDTVDSLLSANLTFHYSDELLIRTAFYQAMSRAPLLQMSAGRTIQSNTDSGITDPNDLIESVSGGNPNLEPLMSDNIDVSFEWYPSLDTAVSLALYAKRFEASFTDLTLNETIIIDGESIDIDVNTKTYTEDAAYLRGFEISAQHHFTDLPAPFDGIGMKGSYNYASSSFKNEDYKYGNTYNDDGSIDEVGFSNIEPANVFGFSKNVFSGSIYWEGDDVSFRVLYKTRSKYYQPNVGNYSNRYNEPFRYLDFNAKYKLSSNTSISLKALNVLDEAKYNTRGIDKSPSVIASSGPKFFLSLKHKF